MRLKDKWDAHAQSKTRTFSKRPAWRLSIAASSPRRAKLLRRPASRRLCSISASARRTISSSPPWRRRRRILNNLLGEPPREPEETEAHLADVAERLYRYFETVAPLFVQLATHTAFHSDHLADAHGPMMESGLVGALSTRLGDLAEKGLYPQRLWKRHGRASDFGRAWRGLVRRSVEDVAR